MTGGNKPIVTAIVPAYNHAKYVKQTIESIINQTYGYDNIELLVIDDFSTDTTSDILNELSLKYDFRFFKNISNRGVVENINTLLKKANGKYIAMCASDDYWDLNKIQIQVDLMESLDSNYAVCHTGAFIINEQGKTIYTQEKGTDYQECIMPKILISNGIVAPSALYKKSVFNEVGLFDETIPFEDREMWIRISTKFKFKYVNKCLVYRRMHKTNVSRKIDQKESYFTFVAIFNKYKSYYKSYCLEKKFHYFLFNHMAVSDFKKSVFHAKKSGKYFFQIHTIYTLFKLFTPKFIYRLGLESNLKKITKSW